MVKYGFFLNSINFIFRLADQSGTAVISCQEIMLPAA
jgi:hypothetical protein